ncbi:MAG: group I intron-associated PD-(D/E)XK endonuclease, partial [Candidatus Sulfotelmatobacter sp.]
ISELAFALAAARQGFGISRPYGDSERYDLILDSSHIDSNSHPRLVRVQVKATTQVVEGLYRVNAHRRINGRAVPYTLAEIDFFAAYVIPEDSWFIFPLPHILGLTSLLLSPKKRRRPGLYDNYREAWPLLRQPDGLEFA